MIAGRQDRFEALLSSHAGVLFKVVRMFARYPEDQQDLAQEIRLQLWRAFGKYEESRSFSTWMYRVALNTAISWGRRSNPLIREAVALEDVHSAAPRPSEEVQVMYQLIDGLDPMNRALLLLYLEELSHAEIGEVLGITAANVATKISRLRQRLKEQATEQGDNKWN
jgi:RNA polymerase sigma-70 factor (ECF subfamily)